MMCRNLDSACGEDEMERILLTRMAAIIYRCILGCGEVASLNEVCENSD